MITRLKIDYRSLNLAKYLLRELGHILNHSWGQFAVRIMAQIDYSANKRVDLLCHAQSFVFVRFDCLKPFR